MLICPLSSDLMRRPRANSLNGCTDENVEHEVAPKPDAAAHAMTMSRLGPALAEEGEHFQAEASAECARVEQEEYAERSLAEVALGHERGTGNSGSLCGGCG